MKSTLKRHLNEPVPAHLKVGLNLPQKKKFSWWIIPAPAVALAGVLYLISHISKYEKIHISQEDIIMEEFMKDMNEFDQELDRDLDIYL